MLALAVGLTVAVVALELLVGHFLPVRAQVYVLDDVLLHDARPGARRIQPMHASRLRTGDVTRVLVTTGDEGFRGASLDEPKERPRLLVIGDSFVMAENVPHDRTFVERLSASLAVHGAPSAGVGRVECVNAGRSGYGPDQSLLQLERRFDDVQPDVVVHVICAHNDAGDLMRNKLVRLGDGGGLERLSPVIGQRMRDEFAKTARRASEPALLRLWKFWRDVDGTRVLVNEVPSSTVDLYVVALGEQYREHLVDRRSDVVTLFEDVYDADLALLPDSPSAKAKVALASAVLKEIAAVCEQRGVPLAFVVVPSAVDISPGFGIQPDASRWSSYDRHRLARTWVSAAAATGALALDMTSVLAADGNGDPYFVGGTDIHWNAEGQRVCAEFVAERLAADAGFQGALGVATQTLDSGR